MVALIYIFFTPWPLSICSELLNGEIPIAGIPERSLESGTEGAIATGYAVCEVGRFITAKGYAHEVIETVALESKLQSLLVGDEVFDVVHLRIES